MRAKLIRDRVPEIMQQVQGKEAVTHVADDVEFASRLLDKLHEEVEEVCAAPRASLAILELADVLEVVYAYAKVLGYTEAELTSRRNYKAQTHGRFDQHLVLTDVREADAT